MSGRLFDSGLVEREGHAFPVAIEYEKQPSFCHHFKVLGHSILQCKRLNIEKSHIVIEVQQKKPHLQKNKHSQHHADSLSNLQNVTGSLIPQPRELVVEECADRVITEPQSSLNEGVATFKEASLADDIEGEVSQNLQTMVFNSADLVDSGDDITLTNSFSRLEDDEIEVGVDINQGETLVSSTVLNVSKTTETGLPNIEATKVSANSGENCTCLTSVAVEKDWPHCLFIVEKDPSMLKPVHDIFAPIAMPVTTYAATFTTDLRPFAPLPVSSSIPIEASKRSVQILKELWGDLEEDEPDTNTLTVQEYNTNKHVETPTKVNMKLQKKKKEAK